MKNSNRRGRFSYLPVVVLVAAVVSACQTGSELKPSPTAPLVQVPAAAQERKDAALIFVHGFLGSSTATWGNFPGLLREDLRLSNVDVLVWDYPTELFQGRIGIRHLSDFLSSQYRLLPDKYQTIYLVGHSLGGVVIQDMIVERLKKGDAASVSRIKHIVLFGSPIGGIFIPKVLQALNTIGYDVDVGAKFIDELQAEWIDRVYAPIIGPGDERYRRAIPLTVVVGLEDTLIDPDRAKTYIRRPEPFLIRGDHHTMKEPASRNAPAYEIVTATVIIDRERVGSETARRLDAHAALNTGWELLRRGEYPHAESTLARARSQFADLKDMAGEGRSVLGQGLAADYPGRYGIAVDRYREALRIYGQMTTSLKPEERRAGQEGQAEAHGELGDVLLVLGRISEAKTAYEQAMTTFESLNDLRGRARINMQLGQFFAERGFLTVGQQHYQSAGQLYEAIDDKAGMAKSLMGRAGVHIKYRDLERARPLLEAALKVFGEQKLRSLEVAARIILGSVHMLGGNLQLADTMMLRGLAECEVMVYTLCKVNAMNLLGELRLAQNRVREARSYFTQARQLAMHIEHPPGRAEAEKGLGDCDARSKRFLEAVDRYRMAVDLFLRFEVAIAAAEASLALGDTYRELKQIPDARAAYERSVRTFRDSEVPERADEPEERLRRLRYGVR